MIDVHERVLGSLINSITQVCLDNDSTHELGTSASCAQAMVMLGTHRLIHGHMTHTHNTVLFLFASGPPQLSVTQVSLRRTDKFSMRSFRIASDRWATGACCEEISRVGFTLHHPFPIFFPIDHVSINESTERMLLILLVSTMLTVS